MIAVKIAYTYTYYTRNFMMLKVRKELYINFTLIKMLPKQKNTVLCQVLGYSRL